MSFLCVSVSKEQDKGFVALICHLSHSWQVKTWDACHAGFPSADGTCHLSSSAPPALIHPVETLRVLNRDMKFLPQFLEGLVRRQVEPVEAVEKQLVNVEIAFSKRRQRSESCD